MMTVDRRYGYEYLKEIMVKRADQKEYMFTQADFPRLNQNDTEDLYLLKRIMIRKRVQDHNWDLKATK
ncbi:hypothetical protein Tco_1046776 [Tanacetum coccineum]